MSDDERDIEIDSDDEGSRGGANGERQFVDKRAHHNALERKRRDHIKESFSGLRDAIPTMQGDKSSRAQILKKASEYISFMRKKNSNHQQDIEDLKRQNTHLEAQIRALERAKNSGQFNSAQEVLESSGLNFDANELTTSHYEANDDDEEDEQQYQQPQQSSQQSVVHVQSVRTIQPGQSLLITTTTASPTTNGTSGNESARKKLKS